MFQFNCFIKGTISIVNKKYFTLWAMATYIVCRLYLKQIWEFDFKPWENDLTAVGSLGYTILTYKLYTQLIK